MKRTTPGRLAATAALALSMGVLVSTGPTAPRPGLGSFRNPILLRHLEVERFEEVEAARQWYYGQRTVPGLHLPKNARVAAVKQARALAKNTPTGTFGVAAPSWIPLGPQPIDTTQFDDPSNGSVAPNGFHDVSGRITAIAVHPNNRKVVYVGAADGGVWKTKNAGRTWKPLGDQLDSLSIGAIAIDRLDPSTVYVGTGEANTS